MTVTLDDTGIHVFGPETAVIGIITRGADADQIEYAGRRAEFGVGFPAAGQQVIFSCNDLGQTVPVEVWAQENGYTHHCQTQVTVSDPNLYCTALAGSDTIPLIAGLINTADQIPVTASTLTLPLQSVNPLIDPASIQQFSPDGAYAFVNASLPGLHSYTLKATRDLPDWLKGVTTYEMILINRHILNQELLDSPFKLIAADANSSGTITTFDIVELRKLILGIYDELPQATSWRFVPTAYNFPNPDNPFQPAFPEIISALNLTNTSHTQQHFTEIKTGDVDNSSTPMFAPADDRTWTDFAVYTAEQRCEKGTIIEVPLEMGDAAWGYQFTLEHPGLTLVELNGLAPDAYAAHQDAQALTMAAFDLTGWAPRQLRLRFRVEKSELLSEMLAISSRITHAEIRDLACQPRQPRLHIANTLPGPLPAPLLLSQAPTPFSDRLTVNFQLPNNATVEACIYDANGLPLRIYPDIQAQKGINMLVFDAPGASGVVYYQIRTPWATLQGRAIRAH